MTHDEQSKEVLSHAERLELDKSTHQLTAAGPEEKIVTHDEQSKEVLSHAERLELDKTAALSSLRHAAQMVKTAIENAPAAGYAIVLVGQTRFSSGRKTDGLALLRQAEKLVKTAIENFSSGAPSDGLSDVGSGLHKAAVGARDGGDKQGASALYEASKSVYNATNGLHRVQVGLRKERS